MCMPKMPEMPEFDVPDPVALPAAAKSAPVDKGVVAPQAPTSVDDEAGKLKKKKSKRAQTQAQNQGAKSLQIPLNKGGTSGSPTNIAK